MRWNALVSTRTYINTSGANHRWKSCMRRLLVRDFQKPIATVARMTKSTTNSPFHLPKVCEKLVGGFLKRSVQFLWPDSFVSIFIFVGLSGCQARTARFYFWKLANRAHRAIFLWKCAPLVHNMRYKVFKTSLCLGEIVLKIALKHQPACAGVPSLFGKVREERGNNNSFFEPRSALIIVWLVGLLYLDDFSSLLLAS